MKNMRKLVPAFAMLMVAAVMLSTASFAWFSSSASVTASGMQVTAKATTGLIMAALTGTSGENPLEGEYVTAVDFGDDTWYTNGASAIEPASIDDGTGYHAMAAKAESHEANADTFETFATDVKGNKGYYLSTKLFFKGLADNAQNLTITDLEVTGTEGGTALNKALRVALKVTSDVEGAGTVWFYFAPNHSAGSEGALKHTATTTAEGKTTYTVEGYGDNFYCGALPDGTDEDKPIIVLSDDLSNTTTITAEVYIYFEGEDPNCKSVLAYDLSTMTINMTFGTSPITAAGGQ